MDPHLPCRRMFCADHRWWVRVRDDVERPDILGVRSGKRERASAGRFAHVRRGTADRRQRSPLCHLPRRRCRGLPDHRVLTAPIGHAGCCIARGAGNRRVSTADHGFGNRCPSARPKSGGASRSCRCIGPAYCHGGRRIARTRYPYPELLASVRCRGRHVLSALCRRQTGSHDAASAPSVILGISRKTQAASTVGVACAFFPPSIFPSFPLSI